MKPKVFLLLLLIALLITCKKDSDKGTSDKVITISAIDITNSSALLIGEIDVKCAAYKSVECGILISEDKSKVNVYEGEKFSCEKLISNTFFVEVTGLKYGTNYYYCAYLILNDIQHKYGAINSFKTIGNDGTIGSENGHEWVDLGLSVKWATCNVGSVSTTGYGDYFAWGNIIPQTTYNWSAYKWCKSGFNTMTKYCNQSYYGYNGFVDNKIVLESIDDAAYMNWGGKWRMPTREEQDELRSNCTWKWISNYNNTGVAGCIISSNTNNNSIFMPAAGCYFDSSLHDVGFCGYYWSSSLIEHYSDYAYYLYLCSGYVDWSNSLRSSGRTIRAVCP